MINNVGMVVIKSRNTSLGKANTIDSKFTRNNAMDYVKVHATAALLKENSNKKCFNH
jgi:hypothetical protein